MKLVDDIVRAAEKGEIFWLGDRLFESRLLNRRGTKFLVIRYVHHSPRAGQLEIYVRSAGPVYQEMTIPHDALMKNHRVEDIQDILWNRTNAYKLICQEWEDD